MPDTRDPIDLRVLDDLIARLRAPDGCPWDREQTLTDLRAYLLEEAFEVANALDNEDWEGLREELGDLLFQVVFLGQINEEEGRFDLSDAIDSVNRKMVDRHPHVFGDETATDARAVAAAWERRKLRSRSMGTSVLKGVNSALPNLLRSYRMTQKAAGVGFDWSSAEEVFEKVREELNEVDEARLESAERCYEEVGDLLFAVANLARHLSVDPEAALARANLKFQRRFAFIEESLAKRGLKLTDSDLEEMEELWEEAKRREKLGSGA
jgi:MazG family protein